MKAQLLKNAKQQGRDLAKMIPKITELEKKLDMVADDATDADLVQVQKEV